MASIRRVLVRSPRLFFSVLCHFILGNFQQSGVDFQLSYEIDGSTVARTLLHDLNVVDSFQPEIVMMQLGSNDLTDSDLYICMLAQLLIILPDFYTIPAVLKLLVCARLSWTGRSGI